MIVRMTFKTPDAVTDAIDRMETEADHGLSDDDKNEIIKACSKWIDYGECITVDVDTEKGTCEVVEN